MELTPEQIQFIQLNIDADVHQLALRMKSEEFKSDEQHFLLTQIAGRQAAKKKIPSWYRNSKLIFPLQLSLEQTSSEATAKYKSSLVAQIGGSFVDLTGGMGIDFSFMAPGFESAIYVEQHELLCKAAQYNFGQLNLSNAKVVQSRAEEFLNKMEPVDLIYLDPARRDEKGCKVITIEDCSPNLSLLTDRLINKAGSILVKYSPMLDISRALEQLKHVAELHVVSVDNECKELLFWLSRSEKELKINTVNIRKNHTEQHFNFSLSEEAGAKIEYAPTVSSFLYEPNASILKAGAFKTVAQRFDLQKLHPNSHLYTSDHLITDFPGRIFEVSNYFSPNRKNIKSFLTQTKKANISVRNFPISVAEIRRKTSLKEGGETYLFATTLADSERVWISCKKS